MVFMVPMNNVGLVVCPCCRDMLHHCKKCWNEHHNGEKHKDYVAPKFFGESMVSPKFIESVKLFNLKHNPSIKPDESRMYKEGEYH